VLQLTRLDNLNMQPEGKIIRAEELRTLLDAEAIIAAAEAERKRIIEEAQAEYERQKQLGYEDGLNEGKLEMAMKMVDSVGYAVDYFGNLENKVVELVLKALRKILGDLDARERVVHVVRTAIGVARNQPNVTLRVCPADAEIARERLNEITGPYPGIHFLEVVPDPRLSATACILETEMGVIDASLDMQLAAIEKSLLKSLGGAAGGSA
jgi:type III secretion protein L